jgi:hypothetical protein
MAMACAQCGAPLPEGTRFCGQCGATAPAPSAGNANASAPLPMAPGPAAAAPPPAPAPSFKGTMMGVAVSDAALAAVRAQQHAPGLAAAQPPPPAPLPAAGAPGRIAGSKTMLGVTASPALAATVGVGAAGAPPAAAASPAAPPGALRGSTMLGVAIPGIAPTSAGSAPGAAPASSSPASPGPGALRAGGTMLGVAIPGIAPTSAGGPPPPAGPLPAPYAGGAPPGRVRSQLANTALAQSPVLPAPAPFVDDVPLPRAPVRREKKGVPLPLVLLLTGGLVVVGGTAILLLARSSTPMTAQPRIDAQGNDVLHLQCDNCADGTTAEKDGKKATFASKEADLELATPLEVGENHLVMRVDRPGSGRDEEVKLVVPVPYRIRADLADIGAKPPVITVRVAAGAGADVTVDGKPLALDSSGKGSYAVDVTSETEGPSPEVRLIDRKIAYVVTLKGGKPESGSLAARIAVVPLRLDEPSPREVIDAPSFGVAGQTVPGGTVTIDDRPAPTQPDGTFADRRDATAETTSIEVRATAPGRAPRTVRATIKKVASLDAEARAEEKKPLLTYDQIAPDIASRVGQRAVVAGEVIEARVNGHQTIALVSDVRGCASGPCLVRLIGAEDAKVARGDSVRAYGTVTRAVATSSGKSIPEVAADFFARGRR